MLHCRTRFIALITCLLTTSTLLAACNRKDGQTAGDTNPANSPDRGSPTTGSMGGTPGGTGTTSGAGTGTGDPGSAASAASSLNP